MNRKVSVLGPVVLLAAFLTLPCWAFVVSDHEIRGVEGVVIQPKAPARCGSSQAAPGSITNLAPGDKICIDTPGFPTAYPANFRGYWLFRATDPNSKLKISCFPVAIQGSPSCTKDYLIIKHGCRKNKYCGGKRPPPTTSCSSWLRVTFRSDRSTQKKGFKCWISATEVSSTSTTTAATTTPDPNSSRCSCGVPNPSRIVGGVPSGVNEYPWLVGLSDVGGTDRPFCGGSIINDEYIVTAAHCVQGAAPSSFEILLNMWDWQNGPTRIIRRSVDRIVIHPNYNQNTENNDIALIHLKDKISFTAFPGIKPVCLPPTTTTDYTGKDAVTTGWGTTSSGGTQPQIAREVTVPIRTFAECQAAYGNSVTRNMICAGLASGGKDSCQGDSGGPLTVPENGKHYLAGVVSWGSGCALPGRYGVYTDVPNYINWIRNTATPGNYCAN